MSITYVRFYQAYQLQWILLKSRNKDSESNHKQCNFPHFRFFLFRAVLVNVVPCISYILQRVCLFPTVTNQICFLVFPSQNSLPFSFFLPFFCFFFFWAHSIIHQPMLSLHHQILANDAQLIRFLLSTLDTEFDQLISYHDKLFYSTLF